MRFVWQARTPEGEAGRRRSRRAPAGRRSEVTVENADEHFCHIAEYGVLICRKHATAVQNLDRHLRTTHGVTAADRKGIVEKYGTLGLRPPLDVALPPPSTRALEVHGTPLDAFKCAYDDCMHITRSFPDQPYKESFTLLGRRSTRIRYRGLWKRLFVVLLRLYRIDDQASKLLCAHLSKRQCEAVRWMWAAVERHEQKHHGELDPDHRLLAGIGPHPHPSPMSTLVEHGCHLMREETKVC